MQSDSRPFGRLNLRSALFLMKGIVEWLIDWYRRKVGDYVQVRAAPAGVSATA